MAREVRENKLYGVVHARDRAVRLSISRSRDMTIRLGTSSGSTTSSPLSASLTPSTQPASSGLATPATAVAVQSFSASAAVLMLRRGLYATLSSRLAGDDRENPPEDIVSTAHLFLRQQVALDELVHALDMLSARDSGYRIQCRLFPVVRSLALVTATVVVNDVVGVALEVRQGSVYAFVSSAHRIRLMDALDIVAFLKEQAAQRAH